MQIVKWCDDNNVSTDTKSTNKTSTIQRLQYVNIHCKNEEFIVLFFPLLFFVDII